MCIVETVRKALLQVIFSFGEALQKCLEILSLDLQRRYGIHGLFEISKYGQECNYDGTVGAELSKLKNIYLHIFFEIMDEPELVILIDHFT